MDHEFRTMVYSGVPWAPSLGGCQALEGELCTADGHGQTVN